MSSLALAKAEVTLWVYHTSVTAEEDVHRPQLHTDPSAHGYLNRAFRFSGSSVRPA